MILESIVTTTNRDGSINISPMGPIIQTNDFSNFLLRPFQTSTTYSNLKQRGQGVLHVTDDVSLFVDAILHDFETFPATNPATEIDEFVLQDCCRFYEFKVNQLEDRAERSQIQCEVLCQGEKRAFWGFNRAKHAVLEAAILATRVHLIDKVDIQVQLSYLKPAIDKTGSPIETKAYRKLETFFETHFTQTDPPGPPGLQSKT